MKTHEKYLDRRGYIDTWTLDVLLIEEEPELEIAWKYTGVYAADVRYALAAVLLGATGIEYPYEGEYYQTKCEDFPPHIKRIIAQLI